MSAGQNLLEQAVLCLITNAIDGSTTALGLFVSDRNLNSILKIKE